MPPKSKSRNSKKEVQDADGDASNSNNCASTKPTFNANVRRRSGDMSTSTTKEPSSASATVSTSIVRARHPTSLSEILTVATATTAAAPTVPQSGKKSRKAGFREQFLQKLRVMLDRESQNDDTIVQWSTDGNSFIVTDQTQFEEEIIPKYFGNSIVFPSFLRKLQRWGFVRVSSIRSGRYEFSSPTFKRMYSRSASSSSSAAAANTTTADAFGNDGGGVSIPFPQQQQVIAQLLNQHPIPVPNQLRRQADASVIAELISNIQRQRSSQQTSTSGKPPGPNQHTIQKNIADLNKILQTMGRYPPPSAQGSAGHTIMGLSGMLPQSLLLNTSSVASGMPTAASSQPNDVTPVLSLLQMLQRFVDEEDQRRVQLEAIQNAILATIGRIFGQGFHNNNAARAQQVGAPPLSRQSIGSNDDNVAQPNQLGAPRPSIGSNTQADSIAAILQAALRGGATGQPGENARAQSYGPASNNDSEDDIDEVSEEDEHRFKKRRKSSPEDEDQYDADDDDDS